MLLASAGSPVNRSAVQRAQPVDPGVALVLVALHPRLVIGGEGVLGRLLARPRTAWPPAPSRSARILSTSVLVASKIRLIFVGDCGPRQLVLGLGCRLARARRRLPPCPWRRPCRPSPPGRRLVGALRRADCRVAGLGRSDLRPAPSRSAPRPPSWRSTAPVNSGSLDFASCSSVTSGLGHLGVRLALARPEIGLLGGRLGRHRRGAPSVAAGFGAGASLSGTTGLSLAFDASGVCRRLRRRCPWPSPPCPCRPCPSPRP